MARRGNSAVGGLAFYLYFSSQGPPRPTRQSALELPRGPAPARRPCERSLSSPRCVYGDTLSVTRLLYFKKAAPVPIRRRCVTVTPTIYAWQLSISRDLPDAERRARAPNHRLHSPARASRPLEPHVDFKHMMHEKQTRHFHDSVSAGRSRGSVTGRAVTANKCIFSRFTSQVPSLRGI